MTHSRSVYLPSHQWQRKHPSSPSLAESNLLQPCILRRQARLPSHGHIQPRCHKITLNKETGFAPVHWFAIQNFFFRLEGRKSRQTFQAASTRQQRLVTLLVLKLLIKAKDFPPAINTTQRWQDDSTVRQLWQTGRRDWLASLLSQDWNLQTVLTWKRLFIYEMRKRTGWALLRKSRLHWLMRVRRPSLHGQ